MRAALGYAPLVEHEYLTGLGKGGYSVGYQDDAGRAEAPLKLGAYLRVGLGVDRGESRRIS